MIYFAMEYMIQPVCRYLVNNGIVINFDKITTGRLQNRMVFCFTMTILITALMIAVLANQRAQIKKRLDRENLIKLLLPVKINRTKIR